MDFFFLLLERAPMCHPMLRIADIEIRDATAAMSSHLSSGRGFKPYACVWSYGQWSRLVTDMTSQGNDLLWEGP